MDFISKLDSSYDIIFLGNPNNPTSKIIPREDIEAIATACKELGIFLVIDESRSQIHTELNLIYSAMLYNKKVKLFKPQANFMLVKIQKDDTTPQTLQNTAS